MNKKIWLVLFIVTSMIFIPRASAECTNSELNKIQSLASAIKFEKKYIGKKSEDEFGVLISGMSDGFAVYANNKVYYNNDLIDDLKPKQTYKMDIVYNKNITCSMKMNYSRKITMPAYNRFHKNEICAENDDIPYCSLTFDSSKMSEEYFNKMVNDYLDSKNSKPIEVEEDNNIMFIVSVSLISVVVAAIIFIIIKSKKKKTFL